VSTCIAIQFPIFQPAMRIVTAITNSFPMVVTTSFAHQYINETIVRLDIPPADGMPQANQLFGPLTVLSPTTFSLPIDSSLFDIFSIPVSPPPYINTCAQVVPIGENNDILTAATRNVLPYGVH
jgi:hypothetical protein